MTTTAHPATATQPSRRAPLPETVRSRAFTWQTAVLWLLVLGPFGVIAVFGVFPRFSPLRPTWIDAAIAGVFYLISGLGITVGFHRYLTHGGFVASRPLRIVLAIAGSLAVEGAPSSWVAAHRRHHAHADRFGDPHSPWRFGNGALALSKGFIWAHLGWLFASEGTNRDRFAADLRADRDVARIDSLFPVFVLLSLGAPAAIAGLATWSWTGAASAFFWAGLVRMFVLHHVTWSTNSVCHVLGKRPFCTRDKSCNFWPLALVSFGESWHNAHHADPRCARHGVGRRQIDISAFVIRCFERLGWAYRVRWVASEQRDLSGWRRRPR